MRPILTGLFLLLGCPHQPELPKSHIYECTWVNTGQVCAPASTPCMGTEREAIDYCVANMEPKACVNNGVVQTTACGQSDGN